jgi:hypothetical protein
MIFQYSVPRKKSPLSWRESFSSVFIFLIFLQLDPIDGNRTVFRVPLDAFHAVIADLFRVQIAAVTFTASDTFPVIEYAHFMQCHPKPPLFRFADYYNAD